MEFFFIISDPGTTHDSPAITAAGSDMSALIALQLWVTEVQGPPTKADVGEYAPWEVSVWVGS